MGSIADQADGETSPSSLTPIRKLSVNGPDNRLSETKKFMLLKDTSIIEDAHEDCYENGVPCN